MRDYQDFAPIEVVAASGCHLTLADGRTVLDAISSWWCKSLGHGHPAPARGDRRPARSLRACDRRQHHQHGPRAALRTAARGRERRARRRLSPRARRPAVAPVTSARCSWPTTDRPPSRSRSRWRSRRRRSAGSRRARSSRRCATAITARRWRRCRSATAVSTPHPTRRCCSRWRSSMVFPTGAVPTTRAGSTPRRSGRRSRRRSRPVRARSRRSFTNRCCRRRGRCSSTAPICYAGCATGRARTGST